ncbi:kinase-like domain-containing protein [Annulohypoxylon bovei var. microspora]|nr:kinase-like domain-containing protein [Annulohypoxylon bovei var. microspora]
MKFLIIKGDTIKTNDAIFKAISHITSEKALSRHRQFITEPQGDNPAHFFLDFDQGVLRQNILSWRIGKGTPKIRHDDVDILIDPGSTSIPQVAAEIYLNMSSGMIMIRATSPKYPLILLSGSAGGVDITLKQGDSAHLYRTKTRLRFGKKPLDLLLEFPDNDITEFVAARKKFLEQLGTMSLPPRLDAFPRDNHCVTYGFVNHCRILGSGAYGRVTSGVDTSTGNAVAIKRVTISQQSQEHRRQAIKALRNEIDITCSVDHENVLPLLQHQCEHDSPPCYQPCLDEYYLVSPQADCNLFEFFCIGPQRPSTARLTVFRDAARGLAYLHANGITHRDISLGNILINTSQSGEDVKIRAVISDLGKATRKVVDDEKALGPPYTIAPEVSARQYRCNPVDIWSIAVAILVCLLREEPNNVTISRSFHASLLDQVETKFHDGDISLEELECIKFIFVYDPDERPTASEVEEVLEEASW